MICPGLKHVSLSGPVVFLGVEQHTLLGDAAALAVAAADEGSAAQGGAGRRAGTHGGRAEGEERVGEVSDLARLGLGSAVRGGIGGPVQDEQVLPDGRGTWNESEMRL